MTQKFRTLLPWLCVFACVGFIAIRNAGPLLSLSREVINFLARPPVDGAMIQGVVSDDCNNPIPFVDILVKGTSLLTTTDSRGAFVLEGVPLGPQIIEAFSLYHRSSRWDEYSVSTERVMVQPVPPLNLSIQLNVLRSPTREAMGKSDAPTGTCQVHEIPMRTVLVPIEYGLPNRRPDYEKVNFPNAEPWAIGGCLVQKLHYAWVPRCPTCVDARNAHLSGKSWGDQSRTPLPGWSEYHLGGVQFRAPAGAMELIEDECDGLAGSWSHIDPRIQIFAGYGRERLAFERRHDPGETIGWIVDHVYGEVWREGRGEQRNLVGRFPLPKSSEWLLISISLDDSTSMGQAWAIMNSIRLES